MAAATVDLDAAARSAAGTTGRAAAGESAATAPAPTGATVTTGAARRGWVATTIINPCAKAGGVDAERLGSGYDERRWRQQGGDERRDERQ